MLATVYWKDETFYIQNYREMVVAGLNEEVVSVLRAFDDIQSEYRFEDNYGNRFVATWVDGVIQLHPQDGGTMTVYSFHQAQLEERNEIEIHVGVHVGLGGGMYCFTRDDASAIYRGFARPTTAEELLVEAVLSAYDTLANGVPDTRLVVLSNDTYLLNAMWTEISFALWSVPSVNIKKLERLARLIHSSEIKIIRNYKNGGGYQACQIAESKWHTWRLKDS